MGFAVITLCVAPQRVVPKVSVYFVIDSVRKLLGTPSYIMCIEKDSRYKHFWVVTLLWHVICNPILWQRIWKAVTFAEERTTVRYVNNCMSQSKICERAERFKTWQTNVLNDARSGRPSLVTCAEVKEPIYRRSRDNRKISAGAIVSDMSISYERKQ